jgi:hypothetical protein
MRGNIKKEAKAAKRLPSHPSTRPALHTHKGQGAQKKQNAKPEICGSYLFWLFKKTP